MLLMLRLDVTKSSVPFQNRLRHAAVDKVGQDEVSPKKEKLKKTKNSVGKTF